MLTLLLVEPDHLLRWSLSTYLNRWFKVITATTVVEASEVVGGTSVAALVVSDSVTDDEAQVLIDRAKKLNAGVRMVRTLTLAPLIEPPNGSRWVEKPFELAEVARALGVDVSSG